MTIEFCVYYCNISYLAYAGLENGEECYCGNITTSTSTNTSDSDCSTPCSGNTLKFCGGYNRLSLYWGGRPRQPDPTLVQNVGMWTFAGCYSDSGDARTLTVPTKFKLIFDAVTVEKCLDACELGGYSYAGVVSADECWCGNSISPTGTPLDPSLCSVLACSGNSSEYCGGGHSIITYDRPR